MASRSLTAAAISIVLAGILGAILGVGRLMPNAVVRWVCSVFVEFFRAVPVLIMMIFAYFLYAQYDLFPPKHLALAGVVTGLTLYNSAVIAEILSRGDGRLCMRRPLPSAALDEDAQHVADQIDVGIGCFGRHARVHRR